MPQSKKIKIPDDLIGREQPIAVMLENFKKISRGQSRMILIRGHSGVGKTSLVKWLKEPVQSKNGLFIVGKFDQYQLNTPYYAIRKALNQLWHTIQSFDEIKREKFHTKIYNSIGDLGFLLIELIPEISIIFDRKPPIQDSAIGFIEARHRFAFAIRKFLEVICIPEHPVVMFIDDWQWADAASMELLKGLLTGTSLRYFLFVAAYRDEEVGNSHPLINVISELNRQPIQPEVIEVRPLTKKDIKAFVVNALNGHIFNMDPLIERIFLQTHGNPFYIRAFLEYLYEDNRIRFDDANQSWHWDLNENLPMDVIDLFVKKLNCFDASNRELISLAACLGNHFDMDSLSTISNYSHDDCKILLEPFEKMGLIFPIGKNNTEGSPANPSRNQWFCFFHDRIQEAAFLLIQVRRIAETRLKIGRLLLSRLDKKQIDERLFEVLEHFNAGATLIHDVDEQKRMVALNMEAAHKSKSATAFNAMLNYNRMAFHFAKEMAHGIKNFWNTNYEQALILHRNLAESEFLEGDREKAEQYIQQSLRYTRTAIERAESLNILIVHYTLLARYNEAIAAGRQALSEFQILLPDNNFKMFRDDEIKQIKTKLKGKCISNLQELAIMQDCEMLTVTRLLITLGPPCYRAHQHLWSVIVPKVVNITLSYGLVPQIGYSHTAFGGLLGWIDNDYKTAKEFGDLSEHIMGSKFGNPSDLSVFYLMIGSSIRHWFKHLKYASADYHKAYDIGLQSGNMQYAAYAFGHNMYCSFYQAVPLSELIRETEQSLIFSRSRLNHWAIDLLEGGIQIFKKISGSDETSEDTPTDDSPFVRQVEAHKNIQVLCIYKVLKIFFHMLFNHHKSAFSLLDETDSLIYTVGTQGLLPWPEYVFTKFLVLSALFKGADIKTQSKWRSELKNILAQLHIWSVHCPENYLHKYYLATAELKQIENSTADAILFYDRAIKEAHQNGFLQWEAIANERAFRFWQNRQNGGLAQIYRQQAYNCYQEWGAVAKLASMKNQFQEDLASWYIADSGSGLPDVDQMVENKNIFIENHIGLLESQSQDKLSVQHQKLISKEADDLAVALEQLREETAERKKAELYIRENEQRYQKAQKLGKVGNWEYNLHTAEFWGSDEAKRIYGFALESENFTTKEVENRIPERERVHQALMDLIEKNKPYDLEFEIHPGEGSKRKIIRSIAELQKDDSGKPVKVTGVIQDITHRKEEELQKQQLEQRLLQAQKIKAIGTFAGGIAHDFNNILYPIIGFAELSIQDLPENHPVQENLQDILQGAKRARDLVKQILAFSNQRDMEYKPLALQPIIEETLKLLRSIMPSNIEIRKNISKDNLYVFANATEFHEVITNICTNAYHAMEENGGTLELILEKSSPEPELKLSHGQYCCMLVRDTGMGIPEEIMDHIYDPYFTTKDQGKGSGLGLSVVHGIIKSYKGAIDIKSQQGKGTTVRMFFPTIPEPDIKETNLDEKSGHTGNENILLVDDERAIVKLGTRMLERLGYNVTGKTDSVEALTLFESNPNGFDLVITDMTMPRLLGTDLAKRILKIRKDIPILICTGFSERVDKETADTLGIKGYINKPLLQEEFTATVRELLNKHKGN